MMHKISAMLIAALFAATTFAPVAEARDGRRDGYSRHYDRDDDRGRRHYRHHDNNDDELAAGVVGLVLGLAIGSLASQPSQPRGCYDRCGGQRDEYYQRDSGYYEGRGGAYERDYGLEGDRHYEDQRPQCVRRERQWDRYANRYVTVDVPC
ncbi:hypothetical protein [Terricaulis silvestris]|uniref:Uncharacterized protein n=1 Tax=Terricaulis silvestris TaxID=2686094 RepID=A0A6I6MKN0_9CAUL|nr:hypothetical protein [Terricaulis silvestris]QGZ93514.1 hypothetical protein DSM104635_00325 [Terricaulis silvestris]